MSEATLRRVWLAAIAVLVALIVVASLSPLPVVTSEAGSDKYAHFAAYFVLALLGSGIASPETLWRAMSRCFLLGLALECAQAFLTEHRVGDWGDLAANGAGILTAWLMVGRGRAGWGLRAAEWLRKRRPS